MRKARNVFNHHGGYALLPLMVSVLSSPTIVSSTRSDNANLELQKNLVFFPRGTNVTILAIPLRDSTIRREAEQSKRKVGHVVELLE